jgi:arylsulfatase A-like enzyme
MDSTIGGSRQFVLFALAALLVGATITVVGFAAWPWVSADPPPAFRAQACALEGEWLERIKRGHYGPHSGDISILPAYPAYMASGAGGWSHSGPWPYLQRVPLVFYGPGLVPQAVSVDRPVTMADVAPTLAAFLKGSIRSDGQRLREVAPLDAEQLEADRPKLIVTVVWDGGGWNTLDQWPAAWPHLRRLIDSGVSYTNATVGSSPSVTPSIHTTLGTGFFPATHGISGIPVRDETGEVEDSFLRGESSRFLQTPTLAERWDEQNNNDALMGMIGYEPWHLGMIGMGAERRGGDRDDAAWLDIDTNDWITNSDHYRLPRELAGTAGLEDDLRALDGADGEVDGSWRDNEILNDPERVEETPAFVAYHGRAMLNVMDEEGYGDDSITDMMFTNFKQIDRNGHYYSMSAEEVRDSVVESDRQLGVLVDWLDREIGAGDYLVVLTADHGQQPDESAIDGYGINPTDLEEDLKDEFGPVVRGVWPTEVFLYPDAMEESGVSVDEIARFIADYPLEDNVSTIGNKGSFEPGDRLFEMAIPSRMLPRLNCP